MLSVGFGLVAAMCWGVHDVCVRFAVARFGALRSILAVMFIGLAGLLPLALWLADWSGVSGRSVALSVAAGLSYAAGNFSLYRAFAIGPVRLVAPIIGGFPVISVGFAAFQGVWPDAGQMLAVAMIVAGVGLIATLAESDEAADRARVPAAIAWSIAGAAGFATTFALAQAAGAAGGELPAIVMSRATAAAALLVAAVMAAVPLQYDLRAGRMLLVMGVCDAIALALVTAAGALPRPEFAAVTASVFGVITILLARIFLGERLSPGQWLSVAIVFGGVAYLSV